MSAIVHEFSVLCSGYFIFRDGQTIPDIDFPEISVSAFPIGLKGLHADHGLSRRKDGHFGTYFAIFKRITRFMRPGDCTQRETSGGESKKNTAYGFNDFINHN